VAIAADIGGKLGPIRVWCVPEFLADTPQPGRRDVIFTSEQTDRRQANNIAKGIQAVKKVLSHPGRIAD
jgi:hypothetical protein